MLDSIGVGLQCTISKLYIRRSEDPGFANLSEV